MALYEVRPKTRRRLGRSRDEMIGLLSRLSDDALGARREGSSRTVSEEIVHVGFVELMYAAWTFDLQSREGLARASSPAGD